MFRASSKKASSFIASQPPMFTKASFFALIVQPSVNEQNSMRISAIDFDSYPASRCWMK